MPVNNNQNVAYGFSQALLNVVAPPIVSKRAPTTADLKPIGQLWVNILTNIAYIETSITNNAANWAQIAGAAGAFTSLTVAPGPTSLTGALTVVGAGNAIQIGNDAAANTVTLGSTNTTSTTTIQAGTGGIALNAGGSVSVQTATATAASPVAAVTISKRVGEATFTGFTTAAAGTQIFTITNTTVTAASAILLTVSNGGTNDARMSLQQLLPSANTIEVITVNNGTQALNGNVTITFWVLN